jgi:acyl-CoA thioester hydrolase
MKEHEFKVRVRYSETDQMGVVYHGNYAQYFEMWNGLGTLGFL